MATWWYMPGVRGKPSVENYYCDEHVARGCSCMVDESEEYLKDDQGRFLPCCEYNYSEIGFKDEDN